MNLQVVLNKRRLETKGYPMLLIQSVLDAEDLAAVHQQLETLPFRDGRLSAGATARRVKSNRQAQGDAPLTEALGAFIRKKLSQNALFTNYARPARWSKPLFSLYGLGDAYGLHTDDALHRDEHGSPMRTDLSFTLFLSPSDAYEGGALSLDGPDGTREVKLEAGDMVVYRTGLIHEVTPVSSGERRACVGWIQSLIRREDQREVLFDLWQLSANLPDPAQKLLSEKSIGNLLRMWVDI